MRSLCLSGLMSLEQGKKKNNQTRPWTGLWFKKQKKLWVYVLYSCVNVYNNRYYIGCTSTSSQSFVLVSQYNMLTATISHFA